MSVLASALVSRPFAERGLLALRMVAVAGLAWVVASVLAGLLDGDRMRPLAPAWPQIVSAAGCYLFGHVMRIVRLALLIGNARLSLRRLATFHIFTSGVALAAPWRLGDVYRAFELGKVTGRLGASFAFVWIERLFDAAILLPVLAVLLILAVGNGLSTAISNYSSVTVFLLVFVLISMVTVALLPDNLRRIGTYLIRRHEAPWTVPALQLLEEARWAMRGVPSLLRGRVTSLAALSVLVWVLEMASFYFIMAASAAHGNPVKALFAFLSETAASGTLPQTLGTASLSALAYLVATQVPLALLAAPCGYYYFRSDTRIRFS